MKLKAKDLMIGNYVLFKRTDIIPITTIGLSGIQSDTDEQLVNCGWIDLDPIPLTEDWLLKFRFEKVNENSYRKGNVLVWLLPNGSGEFDFYFCSKLVATRFFIHQLQNLYFVLVGEELCLK